MDSTFRIATSTCDAIDGYNDGFRAPPTAFASESSTDATFSILISLSCLVSRQTGYLSRAVTVASQATVSLRGLLSPSSSAGVRWSAQQGYYPQPHPSPSTSSAAKEGWLGPVPVAARAVPDARLLLSRGPLSWYVLFRLLPHPHMMQWLTRFSSFRSADCMF